MIKLLFKITFVIGLISLLSLKAFAVSEHSRLPNESEKVTLGKLAEFFKSVSIYKDGSDADVFVFTGSNNRNLRFIEFKEVIALLEKIEKRINFRNIRSGGLTIDSDFGKIIVLDDMKFQFPRFEAGQATELAQRTGWALKSKLNPISRELEFEFTDQSGRKAKLTYPSLVREQMLVSGGIPRITRSYKRKNLIRVNGTWSVIETAFQNIEVPDFKYELALNLADSRGWKFEISTPAKGEPYYTSSGHYYRLYTFTNDKNQSFSTRDVEHLKELHDNNILNINWETGKFNIIGKDSGCFAELVQTINKIQ